MGQIKGNRKIYTQSTVIIRLPTGIPVFIRMLNVHETIDASVHVNLPLCSSCADIRYRNLFYSMG